MNESNGNNYDILDLLSKTKINEANKVLTQIILKTKEDEKNKIRFEYYSKPNKLTTGNVRPTRPNN
jgi:hypothetical protein